MDSTAATIGKQRPSRITNTIESRLFSPKPRDEVFPFFADAPEHLHPKVIVLERSDAAWHDDCRALLISHGYSLIAETRLNLVFEKHA